MADTYTDAIKKAQQELKSLIEQRRELDKKIHRVRQGLHGLAALADKQPESLLTDLTLYEHRGLTSGIKAVLQKSKGPKTAAEVRQMLLVVGYDLSNYANVSAVINTVLNRLAEQELVEKNEKAHPATYFWQGEKNK
ncbi:MAG TPA: hypothetical protein VNW97_08040 [Candidatus Saccharimonadales bacterium]|nr:hypothetical protein [Candidatus Saccharimonadales bacterium]